MSARDEILARIAEALADVPEGERPDDVDVPRAYGHTEQSDRTDRFVERASGYRADVRSIARADLATSIGEICRERGIERLGVPDDLPVEWLPNDIDAVPAEHLDPRALDTLGAALTGCALAIAETGTIVLDTGPRQGPRALTLVPDHHLCVVEHTQILDDVPQAIGLIADTVRDARRPITFVSGPSATSDIELDRVEGVHGPRELVVLVVS